MARGAAWTNGALFPAQLGSVLQMVPAQVEDVLGELAAARHSKAFVRRSET
jgi:hypothetical protein